MATVSKLVLTFLDSNGGKVTQNHNHADPDVTDAQVKSLMQTIVTNGSIFATPPSAIQSAKIVTTETTSIDLS